MFRIINFYLILTLFFISNSYSNIEIKARTAILQDFLSGEILYEKDADNQIYPEKKKSFFSHHYKIKN